MSRKMRIKEYALYVVFALVMLSIYLYFQIDRTPETTFEYPEIEKVQDGTDIERAWMEDDSYERALYDEQHSFDGMW